MNNIMRSGGAKNRKTVYYFSHDCNARRSPKILKLISRYGYEGYGWFWAFVEIMREREGYSIRLEDLEGYAIELQSERQHLQDFIIFCIEAGLFVQRDGSVYSPSLLERMQMMEEKSIKARNAALIRWGTKQDKKIDKKEIIACFWKHLRDNHSELYRQAYPVKSNIEKGWMKTIDELAKKHSLGDILAVVNYLKEESSWKDRIISLNKLTEINSDGSTCFDEILGQARREKSLKDAYSHEFAGGASGKNLHRGRYYD